jgi:WD40 repeat protein
MRRNRSRYFLILSYVVIGLSALSAVSIAAGPPTEPILKIETKMHTSLIYRIATDRENRFLVSGSWDKTVRLWDLKTGSLLKVYRPPIGTTGDEGAIISLALSPDGETVVCGTTKLGGAESGFIYFFDRETGTIKKALQLPARCLALKYSHDGEFLACGLAEGKGIRVYRANDYSLVFEDTDYRGNVPALDFDINGRLVAAEFDGDMRLYSKSFQLTHKKRGVHQRVTAISFTPDGTKVAVAYGWWGRGTMVAVFSGTDLGLLFVPNTTSVGGLFQTVVWSMDGETLYAGGLAYAHKEFIVRSWPRGGSGNPFDFIATKDTITHWVHQIVPLNDGGIVYCSADPAIACVDAKGGLRYLKRAEHLDFLVNHSPGVTRFDATRAGARGYDNLSGSLRISKDASTVQFSYEPFGNSLFSVKEARLSVNPQDAELQDLLPASTYSSTFEITNWGTSERPKFNGKVLPLPAGEVVHNLSVAPSDEFFVLGTYHNLRIYDSKGKAQDRIPTPGVTFNVNISRDGRFIVAAFGDGTIRWYRVTRKDTGIRAEEALAFFPHADKKRWIMWTPEGYFDAAPDSTDLIGYHLNQGIDKESLFISIDNMYDVFYRPDILQAKFRGEDISELITVSAQEALKDPPPTVAFTSVPPVTAEPKVSVCYRARSNGGGIGEVRLFHNGKLIRSDGFYREAFKSDLQKTRLSSMNGNSIYGDIRSVSIVNKSDIMPIMSKPKNDIYEECIQIEAVAGENEVSVAAFNKTNTVQSYLHSRRFNASFRAPDPHLYILSIGIDKYSDSSVDLKYGVKDADDLVKKMLVQAATLYKRENIHHELVVNDQATKTNIHARIREISRQIKPSDSFILFVAAHGILLQNQYYLVTHEYRGVADQSVLIGSNEIVEASKQIKALNQLLIFDTCHAGGVDTIITGLYDARMSVLAKKMGLHIYASTNSAQEAQEGYKGNGLFTCTLLDGLDNRREADINKDSLVSLVELGEYAKEKTADISRQAGRSQTPLIISFGRDNPVYRLR